MSQPLAYSVSSNGRWVVPLTGMTVFFMGAIAAVPVAAMLIGSAGYAAGMLVDRTDSVLSDGTLLDGGHYGEAGMWIAILVAIIGGTITLLNVSSRRPQEVVTEPRWLTVDELVDANRRFHYWFVEDTDEPHDPRNCPAWL